MKWFKSSQKSKALKNCRLSFALKSWNSNSGFSLVGVMVASAVGLVVVIAINQLFVQFSGRLSLQEDRYKQNLFQTYLVEVLSDSTACLNTLGAPLTLDTISSPPPNTPDHKKSVPTIKDSGGTTLIDFFSTAGQERLEKEFGIDSFRELKFEYNSRSASREATLTLITTSMLHSTIPVYNKTAVFTLQGVDVDTTLRQVTNCQVVGVLGVVGGGGTPPNCSNVTDASDDKKTLIGCGGTINITASEVTAIGYEAGGSSTGAHNTFMGFEAGKSSTTGRDNTFIGYQAGENNTSAGRNTFVGSSAGENNTGSNNTFLGHESGQFNTASNNTFVGYQAGADNSSGANNAFIGYQAGLAVTTGSYNTFIGYQSGDAISTGSSNTLIGYRAGATGLSSSSSSNIIIRAGSNQRTLSSSPLISENDDKPGDNNILIGSFSKEKQKELAGKSNFLWIQGLIEGNAKEKWVSIQHDLDAKNLYASLHSLSDKRLKTEIIKLDRSLETINQFKAYRFKWKDAIGEEKNKNHFGFIAQEVKILTPEVVEENRKGFLTVNYPELGAFDCLSFSGISNKNKKSDCRNHKRFK